MSSERNGAKPLLERMEGRDVPAASVTLQGQALLIASDNRADVVLVATAGDQILVSVNGQVQAPIARSAVQVVMFDGGAGRDTFVNFSNIPTIGFGGNGNDILVGGSGANVLLGGNGNDILVGGVGNDILVGESGRDTLFGGPGVDIVFGGEGRDDFPGGRDMNDGFNDGFNDGGNDGFNDGGDDDDDDDDDDNGGN